MKTPKVSVIIVNWNNYKDTSECLESFKKITYPNLDIIVVDNGSEDSSCQQFVANFSHCKVIKNQENLGFAAGNNIGIREALKGGADYVLMINNDTIVKDDFLEPMVHCLEHNKRAGVAGGKIYYYDDPDRIWTVGGDVRILRGGSIYYGGGEKDMGQYNTIKQMTHISGCMSLIKREVLERVGLLSEQFFFRGSEWDFCYRVFKQGYQMFYIPESVIWHKVSRTCDRYSPVDIYSAYRAKIIFVNNFLPKPLNFIWYCLFYLYATFYAPSKFKQFAKKRFNKNIDVHIIKKVISLALEDGRKKDRVTVEDIKRIRAEFHG